MQRAPRFFSNNTAPQYLYLLCLYERNAVTLLWRKLTTVAKQQWKWKNISDKDKESSAFRSAPKRTLQVRGPPGSGKSSATYHWVVSVCRAFGSNIPAIWINCAGDSECWTVQYDEGVSSITAMKRDVPLADDDFAHAHTVVFDGVRLNTLERWRGQANRLARRGILVVIVSSEGVHLHAGDSQDNMKLDHFVPSWRKTEYYEACQDDEFWSSNYLFINDATQNDSAERRQELLDQKFDVAGHSARFMFKQADSLVAKELHEKAVSMGGIDSLEAAAKSDRSAGAVNTLVARFQDGKNGPTPEQTAEFPSAEDFSAVATSIQELLLLPEEEDPLDSSACLVSAVATKEVIAVIPSTIERLRLVGKALDNQAIIGYAFERQLRRNSLKRNSQDSAFRLWAAAGLLLF